MVSMVGCEYLIGNAFIYLTKEQFISLDTLNRYRWQVQQYWNSNNIDAILVGEIKDCICDYCDYFGKNNNIIFLNSDITQEILQKRFIHYLPSNIASGFEKVSKISS